jgi:hypothetical protein
VGVACEKLDATTVAPIQSSEAWAVVAVVPVADAVDLPDVFAILSRKEVVANPEYSHTSATPP